MRNRIIFGVILGLLCAAIFFVFSTIDNEIENYISIPSIHPMPTGYIFEIRFRLNDGTDRVNIQRFERTQAFSAHDLFMIWNDEHGVYIPDISLIDRLCVNGIYRIERIAWTLDRQSEVAEYPGDPGLSIQIGDTLEALWHSPDYHLYFVRGTGFNYILNVYAYWVWPPQELQ